MRRCQLFKGLSLLAGGAGRPASSSVSLYGEALIISSSSPAASFVGIPPRHQQRSSMSSFAAATSNRKMLCYQVGQISGTQPCPWILSRGFQHPFFAPWSDAHSSFLTSQCEQTANGTGCTTVGNCGKSPEVSPDHSTMPFISTSHAFGNQAPPADRRHNLPLSCKRAQVGGLLHHLIPHAPSLPVR